MDSILDPFGGQNRSRNALVKRDGPKKSARAPKMTPKALPKRLLRDILRILGPMAEFWVVPGGEGPAEEDVASAAGNSSNSSKMDGFASAGAQFSESRFPDPGDKYK